MNVHILIIEGVKTSVEVFPSRKKMVSRRAEVSPVKTRMLPPIPITRDAAGLMRLASIVNKIHVDGYESVIEESDYQPLLEEEYGNFSLQG